MEHQGLTASITEADVRELEATLAEMEQQLKQLQAAVYAHRGAVVWGRDLLERERQRRAQQEMEELLKAQAEAQDAA